MVRSQLAQEYSIWERREMPNDFRGNMSVGTCRNYEKHKLKVFSNQFKNGVSKFGPPVLKISLNFLSLTFSAFKVYCVDSTVHRD